MSKKKKGKNRSKKNSKRLSRKDSDHPRINLRLIPKITGGNFNYDKNDIEWYKNQTKKISESQKSNYKKRILFISEASYLRTGFSTYMREVLKRLHATNRFEIAEFGSYGDSPEIEPAVKSIPWKYYHNLPTNGIEGAEYGMWQGQQINQEAYFENQFGKWKLPYVLADFQPDFVLLNRDHWMDIHVLRSEFRDNFKAFWMACVDGYPQKWEWMKDKDGHGYCSLDKLFTYSWFGKESLEKQSRSPLGQIRGIEPLDVTNVMQPGVDINVFKPIPKQEARAFFGGIPHNIRFVGTVMRNQPRKLFTRIIESFRIFKEKYPKESNNVKLLLHTSIPDVGWNIPECVDRNGLGQEVMYSYLCVNCKRLCICTFIGETFTFCPFCKQRSFATPNTKIGFEPEHFNYVFNLMDVYIQGSIAEGDGMPVNEAKSCGVPCLLSDYSALHEKARNGGAIPVDNDTLYTEHETMQWRSLFNRNDLAKKLAMLMGNDQKRSKLSKEARECAEKYYNWDLTAAKWEYELVKTKIKNRKDTWEKNDEIKETTSDTPPDTTDNKEWLDWCYKNILGRPKGADDDGLKTWGSMIDAAENKSKIKYELEQHFREMVNKENRKKQLINNPKLAITDPIERIKNIVEESEG